MPLDQFERRLDPGKPADAASYVPFRAGESPWHAAMAATYAHATAPLRRLADRYVLRAALAVMNGQAVPGGVDDAFQRLPAAMAKAEARAGQIDRAAIDMAETALMAGLEGESFAAIVTDTGENGARIQLCDLPVVARTKASGVLPGTRIEVRLIGADTARRQLQFERNG
jgi:exoribonuclease R